MLDFQPEFKYPVTPDPASEGIEYATINPVPNPVDVADLNLTISDDIYQGRASCSKYKYTFSYV